MGHFQFLVLQQGPRGRQVSSAFRTPAIARRKPMGIVKLRPICHSGNWPPNSVLTRRPSPRLVAG